MKKFILYIMLIAISISPANIFSKETLADSSVKADDEAKAASKETPADQSVKVEEAKKAKAVLKEKADKAKVAFKKNAAVIKEKLKEEAKYISTDIANLINKKIVASNLKTYLLGSLTQMADFIPKLIDGSKDIKANVDKISKRLKCLASEDGECAKIDCEDKMACLVSTWNMLNESLGFFIPNLLGTFDANGQLVPGAILGFVLAFMPLPTRVDLSKEPKAVFTSIKGSDPVVEVELKSRLMKQIPTALKGAITAIISARDMVSGLVSVVEVMNEMKKIDIETVTAPEPMDPDEDFDVS